MFTMNTTTNQSRGHAANSKRKVIRLKPHPFRSKQNRYFSTKNLAIGTVFAVACITVALILASGNPACRRRLTGMPTNPKEWEKYASILQKAVDMTKELETLSKQKLKLRRLSDHSINLLKEKLPHFQRYIGHALETVKQYQKTVRTAESKDLTWVRWKEYWFQTQEPVYEDSDYPKVTRHKYFIGDPEQLPSSSEGVVRWLYKNITEAVQRAKTRAKIQSIMRMDELANDIYNDCKQQTDSENAEIEKAIAMFVRLFKD